MSILSSSILSSSSFSHACFLAVRLCCTSGRLRATPGGGPPGAPSTLEGVRFGEPLHAFLARLAVASAWPTAQHLRWRATWPTSLLRTLSALACLHVWCSLCSWRPPEHPRWRATGLHPARVLACGARALALPRLGPRLGELAPLSAAPPAAALWPWHGAPWSSCTSSHEGGIQVQSAIRGHHGCCLG